VDVRRTCSTRSRSASACRSTCRRSTWKWDFNRLLKIQKGFQYGPEFSRDFNTVLKFNRGLKRVLEIHSLGPHPQQLCRRRRRLSLLPQQLRRRHRSLPF
jgi:hypothetical protein